MSRRVISDILQDDIEVIIQNIAMINNFMQRKTCSTVDGFKVVDILEQIKEKLVTCDQEIKMIMKKHKDEDLKYPYQ